MMQLITRCPKCETAFAFEAAQLRLAKGWVRCGKCAMLFEADKHLFERGHEEVDESPDRHELSNMDQNPNPNPRQSNSYKQTRAHSELGGSMNFQRMSAEQIAANINALHSDLKALHDELGEGLSASEVIGLRTQNLSDQHHSNHNQADPLGAQEELSPGVQKMKSLSLELQTFTGVQPLEGLRAKSQLLNESLNAPHSQSNHLGYTAHSTYPPQPPYTTPASGGDPKGSEQRGSRRSSWGYLVWVIALIVLALIQILWSKKEVLGALSAPSHLWVQKVTSALGVELDWPIEPQSLKIVSSSFKALGEANYQIKIRLKNHQDYAVKTPWFELVLLSADESVLVRKIFSTQELELQAAIAPDKDLLVTFSIKVDEHIAPGVVGYKLDFFYP